MRHEQFVCLVSRSPADGSKGKRHSLTLRNSFNTSAGCPLRRKRSAWRYSRSMRVLPADCHVVRGHVRPSYVHTRQCTHACGHWPRGAAHGCHGRICVSTLGARVLGMQTAGFFSICNCSLECTRSAAPWGDVLFDAWSTHTVQGRGAARGSIWAGAGDLTLR